MNDDSTMLIVAVVAATYGLIGLRFVPLFWRQLRSESESGIGYDVVIVMCWWVFWLPVIPVYLKDTPHGATPQKHVPRRLA